MAKLVTYVFLVALALASTLESICSKPFDCETLKRDLSGLRDITFTQLYQAGIYRRNKKVPERRISTCLASAGVVPTFQELQYAVLEWKAKRVQYIIEHFGVPADHTLIGPCLARRSRDVHRGTDVLGILFRNGCSPMSLNQYGEPYVFHAMRHSHEFLMMMVHHGGSELANIRFNGHSLLNLACSAKKFQTVALLIKYGAVPTEDDLVTALSFGGDLSQVENICYHILEAGVSPNAGVKDGCPALILALRHHQSYQLVHLLLSKQADPNVVDEDGLTPLSIAIDLKDEAFILAFLEHGAVPTREERLKIVQIDPKLYNHLPLEHRKQDALAVFEKQLDGSEPVRDEHVCAAALTGSIDLVLRLIQLGGSPNARAEDTNPILIHLMTHAGGKPATPTMIQALCHAGAFPMLVGYKENNALIHAAMFNLVAEFKAMLPYIPGPLDVTEARLKSSYPSFYAIFVKAKHATPRLNELLREAGKWSSLPTELNGQIRKFLERGANPNRGALRIINSSQYRHVQLEELLRDYGAKPPKYQ